MESRVILRVPLVIKGNPRQVGEVVDVADIDPWRLDIYLKHGSVVWESSFVEDTKTVVEVSEEEEVEGVRYSDEPADSDTE